MLYHFETSFWGKSTPLRSTPQIENARLGDTPPYLPPILKMPAKLAHFRGIKNEHKETPTARGIAEGAKGVLR